MLTHQQAPCILCTRDHHLCPAVLFPIASLRPREIRDLNWIHTAHTTLHHLCPSEMPTQQGHTGRLLLVCLVLPFLARQDTA